MYSSKAHVVKLVDLGIAIKHYYFMPTETYFIYYL